MKAFLFNLALVSFSLFVFAATADAHPHKSGVIHHGPSLETYQIELDFSSNRWVQDDPGTNIKVAKKNKNDKHSARGLLFAVNQRKRLLEYLKDNNLDSYKNVLTKLNLRK